MAKPKNDERRTGILEAATSIIAAEGLSAATARIAKKAGVSHGSIFIYFPTKADLLNQLYVELKTEMASAALEGMPTEADARSQMAHMWRGWLVWATSAPEKRRAIAQLSVSDEITTQSREIGHRAMAGAAAVLERSRATGVLRDAPLGLVADLLNAVADATFDFVLRDPANADAHQAAGFDALWRMIS